MATKKSGHLTTTEDVAQSPNAPKAEPKAPEPDAMSEAEVNRLAEERVDASIKRSVDKPKDQ